MKETLDDIDEQIIALSRDQYEPLESTDSDLDYHNVSLDYQYQCPPGQYYSINISNYSNITI
jgi:hypothetical protein